MNKKIKTTVKTAAIILAILAAVVAGGMLYLWGIATPFIPREAVRVTDSRYNHYADVKLIREITQVQDFPPFDAEIYEYTNEKGEREIYLSCVFNPAVPEDTVWNLRNKMNEDFLFEDPNGGMDFTRGWSKKEYMPIPSGVKEEMVFCLSMVGGNNHFAMSFTENPCSESVAKDSLNHYLGVTLPEFTIINYIAPDRTLLQFKEPISKDAYSLLEKNDWCEHKYENDSTSICCWIEKKEPEKTSTHIIIDDQRNTARLSKYEN